MNFITLEATKYVRIWFTAEQSLWRLTDIWAAVEAPVKMYASQWRHNRWDGVSNHRRDNCLLNRLFKCRSKKTSKFHVTGLCVGNSPVTGEFPAQKASNAENVSIWWRHHGRLCHPVVRGITRFCECIPFARRKETQEWHCRVCFNIEVSHYYSDWYYNDKTV